MMSEFPILEAEVIYSEHIYSSKILLLVSHLTYAEKQKQAL